MWRRAFQRSARAQRWHPVDLLPRHQHGPGSAAKRGGNGLSACEPELHRGYIQSWNLIVERKLPGEIVGSIGYVGSASVRGFAFLDINASQIPGSGDEGRPLFAEFGRTTTTREWDGRTHSIYHALQATLNRRFSDGLLLKGAYTWLKAINEAAYSDWTEFMWNAASVFDRNRALADHDTAQLPARVGLRTAVRQAEEVGHLGCQHARSWEAGS